MAGHWDPSRMCTKEMSHTEVAHLVNYISNFKLSEAEWRLGKEPYSRAHPPPVVGLHFFFCLLLVVGFSLAVLTN